MSGTRIAMPASRRRPRRRARRRLHRAATASTANGRVERHPPSQWVMIGGLIHRDGEHHPDMRLFLGRPRTEDPTPGTAPPARLGLEHRRARQRARAGAPQRLVLDPARCLLAGLADQHRADLSHAVHAVHLCAARPGARARAAAMPISCNGPASAASPTPRSTSPSTPVQIRVAEIAAQIDAADLLARRCFQIARDYTRVTLEQRLLLRRDFTYAMRMVRAAWTA